MRQSVVIFILVLWASSGAWSDPPKYTAIVTSGPSTTVSGTAVIDRMAAYPEDDLETHSDDPATVTFQGNTVKLLGKSHIKLHETNHELIAGGTVISTKTRYGVRSGCFSVEPSLEKETKYSVSSSQGHIYIRAEEGEVLVKARREVRVRSGRMLEIMSCGKLDETTRFDDSGHLSYKAAAATGAALGSAFVVALPGEPKSVSAECPKDPCRR